MAIPVTAVWEIRSTATAGNVNGGFFNSALGGTDYSQQNAAQLSLTDCTTTAANAVILRSATGGFTSQMVGNGVRINSGTNFLAGWYEIISFTSGNAVTLDRTPSSAGAGSGGNVNVGGSLSLNSTLDDDFFEALVGGNIAWIRAGSYTIGETISVASTSGTGTNRIKIYGYNTSRGDNPTGTSRPSIACGATAVSFNQQTELRNIIFTTTSTNGVFTGIQNSIHNCKFLNTSTVAGRSALLLSQGSFAIGNECVSQNGIALSMTQPMAGITANYIHDSDIGIQSASNSVPITYNIISRNRTAGVSITSTDVRHQVLNNTFFGAVNTPAGIGLRTTGATGTSTYMYNNIFYGLSTGISIATVAQDSIIEDYNTFNNNTTNRTNESVGANSLTTAPSFTDTAEITGSTATTSGSVLTQSGGNFNTVEDNVDFLRVVSGTGVTTGSYLITSHSSTTLTVNNALGTSSAGDVTYVVGTGHNFSIGTALKATAYPGTFDNIPTISYLDIGAVQRQESSGGGSFTFTG